MNGVDNGLVGVIIWIQGAAAGEQAASPSNECKSRQLLLAALLVFPVIQGDNPNQNECISEKFQVGHKSCHRRPPFIPGNGYGVPEGLSKPPFSGSKAIVAWKGLKRQAEAKTRNRVKGNSAWQDIADVPQEKGGRGRISPEDIEAEVLRVCELTDTVGLMGFHPYDVSGGEQQRTGLAMALLTKPKLLLLDEPTKGMDGFFKEKFSAILRRLCADGMGVLMVSHDVEFCARHADRCALFFNGSIVSEGAPRAFFSGNSFYTTAANRMARSLFPEAITADEVIERCQAVKQPLGDEKEYNRKR